MADTLPDPTAAWNEAAARYGAKPLAGREAPARDAIAPSDWRIVRELVKEGLSPAEIATRTGIAVPVVEQAARLSDTREEARAWLNASALEISQRVVKDADVDQGLEMLDRLEVAPKRQADAGRGNHVTVVVGTQGNPIGPDPFDVKASLPAAAVRQS